MSTYRSKMSLEHLAYVVGDRKALSRDIWCRVVTFLYADGVMPCWSHVVSCLSRQDQSSLSVSGVLRTILRASVMR